MSLDSIANKTILATVTTMRDRDRDPRERDHDPRDVFLDGLELPRGLEREIVMDGDHRYELNGDDSRSLAAVGAFRVVAERDLRDPRDESSDPREPDLRHLRDEGLTRFVALDGRERAVTLTDAATTSWKPTAAIATMRASRPSTPA